MKQLTTFFALAAICASAKAQFIKAELQVSGLTCSMCSLSTQKSLNTLDFIGQIKPDLNKNIFYITFKPDKPVNIDAIKAKVKAAGFSVSSLIAVYNFSNTAIDGEAFLYNNAAYKFAGPTATSPKGETRLKIIDKDFVPAAVFKKYSTELHDQSYNSGINDKKQRVYHVAIS